MHFLSLGWALTLVRCCCSSIAWYFPGLLFRVSVAVGCLFWWQRQEIQSLFCHVFSESEEYTQCAVVDRVQLPTRSLLASFDSTAITRCICSCPVAESNSCQSTSRRARASAHKTVHLPVIARGWVRFHSQPSVKQTAAPSQDSLKDETRCDVQAEWFIVFIPRLQFKRASFSYEHY